MLEIRIDRDGRLSAEDLELQVVAELVRSGTFAWIDISDANPRELAAVAKAVGLQEFALEYANSRPGLHRDGSSLVLAVYTGAIRPVIAYANDTYLITLSPSPSIGSDAARIYNDLKPAVVIHDSGLLLYAILTVIVDQHFGTLDSMEEDVEELEELLLSGFSSDFPRIWTLRKRLEMERRMMLPIPAACEELARNYGKGTNDPLPQYFQVVRDQVNTIVEHTEIQRDFVSVIFDTSLSLQAQRLSESSRSLSSWVAVVGIPTAIAGLYGLYPGNPTLLAFWIVVVVLAGLGGSLYLLFRRIGWL
jgi:magnesium transporter